MRKAVLVLVISLFAAGGKAAPVPLGSLLHTGLRRGLEMANVTSPEFLGGAVYLQPEALPQSIVVVDPAETAFSETKIAADLCSTKLQILD